MRKSAYHALKIGTDGVPKTLMIAGSKSRSAAFGELKMSRNRPDAQLEKFGTETQ